MRRLLLSSSLLNAKIQNTCIRGLASQSAVQSLPGTDRYSTLGQRWQQHENQILIAGVEKQELELEKAGIAASELTRREKWEEIENYCHVNGIDRSAEQCRQRWQRLLHAVSKIRHWESCRPPGKSSFWSMKTSEKKAEGLLYSLDLETYNAINAIQSRKGVACTTSDFSDPEAVSPESPSSEVKVQQQTENSGRQGGNQETTLSVTSNQNRGAHESNQAPDNASMEVIEVISPTDNDDRPADELNQAQGNASMEVNQVTNPADYDDRPALFVNVINECLSCLKDIGANSFMPFKAQADRESGLDNTQERITESPKMDSSSK